VDPVTLIVAALAAGAAAGLKPVAAEAVRDAYRGIKRLITDHYPGVAIEELEKLPASDAKKESLTVDLERAGASRDSELLAAAEALIAAVKEHDAEAAAAVGVRLDDIEAAFLRIHDVEAEGTGVEASRVRTEGGIDISGVRSRQGGRPRDP
jgi:hypothetical protein